mmetsp:Transcript_48995/g.68089  ORF Transcript_48995/g.68089 Transcript_48995/m.68089 type:complete len:227 (+) Transcript_48995:124-804(+)
MTVGHSVSFSSSKGSKSPAKAAPCRIARRGPFPMPKVAGSSSGVLLELDLFFAFDSFTVRPDPKPVDFFCAFSWLTVAPFRSGFAAALLHIVCDDARSGKPWILRSFTSCTSSPGITTLTLQAYSSARLGVRILVSGTSTMPSTSNWTGARRSLGAVAMRTFSERTSKSQSKSARKSRPRMPAVPIGIGSSPGMVASLTSPHAILPSARKAWLRAICRIPAPAASS